MAPCASLKILSLGLLVCLTFNGNDIYNYDIMVTKKNNNNEIHEVDLLVECEFAFFYFLVSFCNFESSHQEITCC